MMRFARSRGIAGSVYYGAFLVSLSQLRNNPLNYSMTQEVTFGKPSEVRDYTLEVCTASMRSVQAAVAGGAKRIELCSALSVGGLTPSLGLLREVRTLYPKLRIHVLIRPREGDFVYSEEELRVMERDIEAALLYADAIVSGAMTPAGTVDEVATRRLLERSQGVSFTFHRAFDQSQNPLKALETIQSLGCARILTSGTRETAESGIPIIRQLVERAAGAITILPGGGVTASNIKRILNETGAQEIHGSASIRLPDGRQETDADIVRDFLKAIH